MLGVGTQAQINTQRARGHTAKTASEQKGLGEHKGENKQTMTAVAKKSFTEEVVLDLGLS